MEERGLQLLWVGRQQQDRAVWGLVQPGAILIPRKHQPPSPPPFIAVHLVIIGFPCIVNHNLFLYLNGGTMGGRKCNGNLC